ncbi:hypothetical protein RvY_03732 [Ramazzottius varieornatus]|uniref:Uncharacterized protein n=1 Tax=Ramazzottius varieornatus TaxID=947166 RepID=A0A1D1UUS0_RAMVA|nr:hypothetical protein RvY_03732 [Ramazzottius varieornatus]
MEASGRRDETEAPPGNFSFVYSTKSLLVSLARLIIQLEELLVVVLQKLQNIQRIDGIHSGHV